MSYVIEELKREGLILSKCKERPPKNPEICKFANIHKTLARVEGQVEVITIISMATVKHKHILCTMVSSKHAHQ